MKFIRPGFFFARVSAPVSVCAAIGLLAVHSQAATISINFTGMDLVYDGSAIYDAGSTAGNNNDPAEADPLATADFFVDGNLVGSLTGAIALDVFIPDVVNIPSTAGSWPQTTPGNPGFFDLLIGSPVATQFLSLDLGQVDFTYLDIANVVQFTFRHAVANSSGQSLPFGLEITDPVIVSFQAPVQNVASANGFITSFEASGTGSIQANAIPEPASAMLLMLGSLAVGVVARRHR